MAYNASYSTSDVTSAGIDLFAVIVISVVSFAGLAVLMWIGLWAWKKVKGL